MNIANYTLTDRYPLSTQGLAFIQGQILSVQKMCAALGSGKWIIDGCEESSVNGVDTISAGAVVIEKEIVEVTEQTKTATCYIREVANQTPNRKTRSLIFGTSVDTEANLTWADFKRVDVSSLATKAEVEALRNLVMPKGAIIMWSGTVNESDEGFPTGFKLCDGRTITGFGQIPDLRSRFIVGFDSTSSNTSCDYSSIGTEGGEAFHTLSMGEMPIHSHSITGERMQKDGTQTKTVVAIDTDTDENNGNVTYNNKIGNAGGGLQHENRPPYYVLAFLIKVV